VSECDLETSTVRKARPTRAVEPLEEEEYFKKDFEANINLLTRRTDRIN
jgi:hypothetical protein